MVRYKIIFDREDCIGAGACEAVAPKFWVMNKTDDEKADLVEGKKNPETGKWELIIDEKDFELAKESADVCPVEVIKIEKIEA